ncbi:hypothetical protein [Paraburkholderia sp. BL10I2N1]|uniref:hypothetical protein n=1 Tax=Paraburkholderia sp. BL10I2N1 TaxID=1938796 RepID=UPI001061A713|nr:hypothetical protein [Paraburkholderia sp. BL10I2N1]TDN70501.1 hypothetical protein B0G77_3978 [Paraburkholderia sp. BL10I2N1]
MASTEKKIWFPAKRYGWGWGLPVTWQGWLVLLLYVSGLVASSIYIHPEREPFVFGMSVLALTGLLVGICWAKGEKPRWRWGGDE